MERKKTLKQKLGVMLVNSLQITKENFDIFRFELKALRIRVTCFLNPIKKIKIQKLTRLNGLSVNLGAGPFGEQGWINIDLFHSKNISFTYDCRKKLPFKNNSVDRIRCEHMLEHLDRNEEVPFFLKECLRCLKDNGILRIVVPDANLFIKAYYQNTEQSWGKLGIVKSTFNKDWTPMDVLNKIFRQAGEHKFGYDFETLRISLNNAGFSNIVQSSYQHSLDVQLVNDQEIHHLHSLYVECVK